MNPSSSLQRRQELMDAFTLAKNDGESASVLQDAMEEMAHGFAVWDENLDVLMFSRRTLELWNIDEETMLRERNMHRLLRLVYLRMGVEESKVNELFVKRVSEYETDPDAEYEQREVRNEVALPDGRWIEILARFTPTRRWVITYTDITARMVAKLELQKIATTDALTGLANRRQFFEESNKAVAMTSRKNQSLPVIMMDLDHFKQINDTYGHAAGDIVLKTAAKTITQQIRCYDIAGRLGGEEFGLVLPDTDEKSTLTIAERIRENIASLVFDNIPDLKVTVSIGASEIRIGESDLDAALARADAALYTAKNNGRNQISVSK